VFFAPAEPWQKTYFNSHFPSENDFFDKLTASVKHRSRFSLFKIIFGG